MLKKIIIISVLIFVVGISSCSMWDDVDKHAAFIIPVSNINVGFNTPPDPTQWNDIPVLFNTFDGSGIADKDLTNINIATNSAYDRLYINISASSLIDLAGNLTSYVILFSKDYNCNGKKILIISNNYGVYNICDTISIAPTDNFSSIFYTTLRVNAPILEISLDVNSIGLNLSNGFLLSIYSSGNIFPYPPSKSTYARWVKFHN